MKSYLLIVCYLFFSACATENIEIDDNKSNSKSSGLTTEDELECNMYNSFAYENFENKD